MTLRKNGVKAAALAATVALSVAACGSSNNNNKPASPSSGGTSAPAASAAEGGAKGGTLNILNDADFDHLDPQRAYVGNSLNALGRLLTRTLVAYKSVPGPDGSTIVPDLATDLGKATNGNKTWTFTLKDGVKFEDGTPITCGDIKYGISRTFSSQITDGPQYATQFLKLTKAKDGTNVYKGPYVAGANGGFDQAITCPDPKTIVFQLVKAIGDFNYTLSLPAFSPVPKAKDTGTKYDLKPVSSGPYKVQSHAKNKSLTLVRNDQWDPKTDTVRKALPDKIQVTMGLDDGVIDSRMIADSGEDQTAIMNYTNVQPQNITRVKNDPRLKKRLIAGYDGFDIYLAINTKKVTNLKVRQAIEYAVDKQGWRAAYGGADFGDYATTVITPALKSHKKFDLYPAGPTGDLAKAKALLKDAGVPLPYPIRLDFRNRPTTAKGVAAVKAGMDAAGFKVTLNPIAVGPYYATIGKTATEGDMVTSGWGPDWPNGSSVIPPLFDGRFLVPEGNQNYAQLADPAVNAAIDKANAETDLAKQAPMWGEIDQMVLERAAIVPMLYSKVNQMFGSKVKGAYLHAFYGEIDLATVGVA